VDIEQQPSGFQRSAELKQLFPTRSTDPVESPVTVVEKTSP